MTDISAFPTITNVLESGVTTFPMTATTAVKGGQVVAIHATGVSGAVDKSIKAAGSRSIGVALADASAGDQVTVCGPGCIVTVANADDTTGIDAGDFLETNDNAVGGTVSAANAVLSTSHNDIIGIALDDIAGGGTGRMLVSPMVADF